ncbi:hypothetical protein OSTOST_15458 [Ostertagia ostertagi]
MKGDGSFQSMTSFRFSETYLQHIMSGPIVDLLIRNDKSAALEALRNLWSYRLLETLHLESCDLSDQDLESIRPGSTCVKYVCLRNNQLVHPWSTLAKNFPALNYLDCRENRWLTMDLSAMKGLQLAHMEHLFLSTPVSQCAAELREVLPKLSDIHYSLANFPFMTANSDGNGSRVRVISTTSLSENSLCTSLLSDE